MLENLAKPVGLHRQPDSDRRAAHRRAREPYHGDRNRRCARSARGPLVPEVSLYFQNRLFRANRTTKRSAEALERLPFLQLPAAGRSGRQHRLPPRRRSCRPAESPAPNCGSPRSSGRPRAGHPPLSRAWANRMLRAMLSAPKGCGPWCWKPSARATPPRPTGIHPRRARSARRTRACIVLNVTQCGGGRVADGAVRNGARQLQEAGVLCGHDMTAEAAVDQTDVRAGAGAPGQNETQRRSATRPCAENLRHAGHCT